MNFGQHLRRLSEGAGLSRAELARRAAVPVSTLHNWEGSRALPGLPALLRLPGALGVTDDASADNQKPG
jgi:transcriptional regulator with XRE-family HTH domain